jgi:hypothetical protein
MSREELIADILNWVPPRPSRRESAKRNLALLSKSKLKKQRDRLALLEKWAKEELATKDFDERQNRAFEARADAAFAADIITALDRGDDLHTVVDRHANPKAPAVLTQEEETPHIERPNPSLVADHLDDNFLYRLRERTISAVRHAFPRTLLRASTPTPQLTLNIGISNEGLVPQRVTGAELRFEAGYIAILVSFDFERGDVRINIPESQHLKGPTFERYLIKKAYIERVIRSAWEAAGSYPSPIGNLVRLHGSVARQRIDSSLAGVAAGRMEYDPNELLYFDNAGLAVTRFAAEFDPDRPATIRHLVSQEEVAAHWFTKTHRGSRAILVACIISDAAEIESTLRYIVDRFAGVEVKLAAVGITESVRRRFADHIIGVPASIGLFDPYPWDPEGEYKRTELQHVFGYKGPDTPHTSHHIPVRYMDILVERVRRRKTR